MRQTIRDFAKKELPDNTLLITCGLPASGKTITSQMIAKERGFQVLRTDTIRLDVLKNEDVFDQETASDMNKRMAVYNEMFKRAGKMAEKGCGIILDATFITQALRKRAASIAAEHSMLFAIQENICPGDICIRRISERTKEDYQSNAISEQAYTNNLKRFEPVDIDDIKKLYPSLQILHFTVDSSSDVPEKWYIASIDKKS